MAGSISFDGLVSGINSSEIVSQLMAVERQTKIVPLQKREATLTAKQAAWRDVRSGLAGLQSRLMDLKLVGTYTGMKAASANEEVVTAKAKAGAGAATYTIKVEQLATAQQMWSTRLDNPEAALAELGLEDGKVLINNVEIKYSKEDTLAGLAQKINAAMKDVKDVNENGKVSASVVDGRLVLKAAETGSSSSISLGGDEAGAILWQKLGLDAPAAGYPDSADSAYVKQGQNAVFYVDGVKIERSSNKVDDAISGVTLELTGVSKKIEGGSGWEGYSGTKLTVEQDVDKAVQAVKAFVDEYNRVWQANRSKQAWDKDTKQGALLFGDSTLNGIQYRLRGLVTSPIDGASGPWSMLVQIGISTGKVGTGVAADGTLYIDETKLREALQEDPEAVAALFTGEQGMAGRLDAYLKEVLTKDKTGLLTAKDEALSSQIKDLQKQTERMEERLAQREERLKQQYVQLEKALAQLQSQGNWLAMQIAGFTGGEKA
ncbi:MAG: flagellar filament capping protein FliD [Firmicutes bacterium]|nr:flagellar filament capping protein FliD [Bacillota bacterium]